MNNRPRNLTEQLIREVQNTPLLWNKLHDLYNNRVTTDGEWDNIALTLNYHKEYLRQKWKNLRDQFHKELKRVYTPLAGNSNEDYMNYYTGKWKYFEQLLFLKDTIKHKGVASELEYVKMPGDDIIKEETMVFDEGPLLKYEYQNNCDSNIVLKPFDTTRALNNHADPTHADTATVARDESCPTIVAGSECSVAEKVTTNETRKRGATEELPANITCKRMSMTNTSDDAEDADLSFFKSLLPFMRTLNPIRKLMVRNEIQNILIKENMCDKCNGHKC